MGPNRKRDIIKTIIALVIDHELLAATHDGATPSATRILIHCHHRP